MKPYKTCNIFHTPHNLHIVQCESVKEALENFRLKDHSFDENDNEWLGIKGGVHLIEHQYYDLCILLKENLPRNKMIAVLAHELIHVAYAIEIDHGKFFGKNAQETLCYFMEKTIEDYLNYYDKSGIQYNAEGSEFLGLGGEIKE